ncbi:MAG: serine/threonine-protein kinase [Rhodoferax sp.]|nr:serine/threonine-protein kinase [Rhodoferax sp.]
MRTRPNQPGEPPAASVSHIDALSAGTMLGEFEVQSLLAVGGFGMVYRGYDHTLHRPVAIKEYMPSALVGRAAGLALSARSEADNASFQTGLQSFIDEARLLAQFDHPSLVKVYRFWEANNTAYMAMPLYAGMTLKEARRRMSGPPPEAWLRKVLWSVLEALQVLHDADTLHRDVSPDNIFLQDVGPPVLLDLGAARHAILESSQKHTAILKVNYAPIEQYADAEDLREGPWTDLYALAAVVHGCVCNEAPLPATFRVVRDRMPSFAQVAQTAEAHFGQAYAGSFVSAVSHALAIEPGQRPQSTEALAAEMQLLAPEDLARFDWRAALGSSITLEATGVPVVDDTTIQQTTQPAPQPRTQSLGRRKTKTGVTVRRVKSRKKRVVPRRLSPVWWWLWGTIAMVLVTVLIFGIYKTAARRTSVQPQLDTPVAAPVAPPVPEAPGPTISSLLLGGTPAVASGDKSARRPLPRASVSAADASKAAQSRVEPPIGGQAGAAAKSALTVPEGAAQMAPAPELCADATILTRSMCVYRECQKPQYAQLPLCIADRKHWDAQNRKILP